VSYKIPAEDDEDRGRRFQAKPQLRAPSFYLAKGSAVPNTVLSIPQFRPAFGYAERADYLLIPATLIADQINIIAMNAPMLEEDVGTRGICRVFEVGQQTNGLESLFEGIRQEHRPLPVRSLTFRLPVQIAPYV
jgi:hypothetical protein